MPVVFHTNAEGSGCSCTRVAAVARQFPDLAVVMAHLYDKDQFSAVLPLLRQAPNLYWQHMHLDRVKLDTGKTALEELVGQGLASRIVFGTDVQNDHSAILDDRLRFRQRLHALGLAEEQIHAVLVGTAERLFSRVKPLP